MSLTAIIIVLSASITIFLLIDLFYISFLKGRIEELEKNEKNADALIKSLDKVIDASGQTIEEQEKTIEKRNEKIKILTQNIKDKPKKISKPRGNINKKK